jgi:putative transposase
MPNYRRNRVAGGTHFFTVVTLRHRPILTTDIARPILHRALAGVQRKRPFAIDAIVLLPDHLHAIWTLPAGESDYSLRWAEVKEAFTRSFLSAGGEDGPVSPSRRKHPERSVWQRRFWEHTVRDEDDFKRCADYVHWNPVKHGLVARVRDYPWSSFHRYVESGEYDLDWGSGEVADVPGAEWE